MSYFKNRGFDSSHYLAEQSRFIMERAQRYDKLYLEVGGKMLGDLHAMRVLPGFEPDIKIQMLQRLKDDLEIIICIYAGDIEQNKIRGDYGISYDLDVFRMIDEFKRRGLLVSSVCVTRYQDQPSVRIFMNKLERRGIRVYVHRPTKGYPLDVDTICSEEGYGQNAYIETTRSVVVVTAPGPNSGKLATCLSQLYHETKLGHHAGYSKFETFPIWSLPLKHPVNVAYEAATADLADVNMIDSFHLEATGESAVNYNRDIEAYPLLKRILERITFQNAEYRSPTEMGVNRAGFAIIDDAVCQEAARQEILRRYLKALSDYKEGTADDRSVQLCKMLVEDQNLSPEDRPCLRAARQYVSDHPDIQDAAAIELEDGRLITGKSSPLMTSVAAMLLNALKSLSGIDDRMDLLSPLVLKPIRDLKSQLNNNRDLPLDASEVLLALSVSALNPMSAYALQGLPQLKSCQCHATVMLQKSDRTLLSKLGIDFTNDPNFANEQLFNG